MDWGQDFEDAMTEAAFPESPKKNDLFGDLSDILDIGKAREMLSLMESGFSL